MSGSNLRVKVNSNSGGRVETMDQKRSTSNQQMALLFMLEQILWVMAKALKKLRQQVESTITKVKTVSP